LSGEDAGNLDDIFPYARLFVVRMVDDYFSDIV
jgi:transposase InsO family protein